MCGGELMIGSHDSVGDRADHSSGPGSGRSHLVSAGTSGVSCTSTSSWTPGSWMYHVSPLHAAARSVQVN